MATLLYRHPYCLLLRSRPCRHPPRAGTSSQMQTPLPLWTRPSRSMHHVPRSAPVTDVPRPGVQRLIALPAAAGPPPRPSSAGPLGLPLARDSTASEPISQQVLPVFYTWHWVSCTRGGWSVGSWGDLGIPATPSLQTMGRTCESGASSGSWKFSRWRDIEGLLS